MHKLSLGYRTQTGTGENSRSCLHKLSLSYMTQTGKFPLFLFARLVIYRYFDYRLLDSNGGNFPCSQFHKLSICYRTLKGEFSIVFVCTVSNIYSVLLVLRLPRLGKR